MSKLPEACIDAARADCDITGEREIRARRVILALAENLPDSAVEKAARALCVDNGNDPDCMDRTFICDAGNNALPAWRWYEDQARTAIIAALKEVEGSDD